MKKLKLFFTAMIILTLCLFSLTACDFTIDVTDNTLADAKSSAISSLDTAFAKYDAADYTDENYALIDDAYNTAKDSINAVTDSNNLPGDFVSTFISSADAVPTITDPDDGDDGDSGDGQTPSDPDPDTDADDTATALATKKAELIASLDAEFAKYIESEYTADNYALIETAYNTAKDGINAVTDIENLTSTFVDTFISSANNVATLPYTVTFDDGYGTTVQTVENIVKNDTVSSISAPEEPTGNGASFVAWTLNGLTYDFSTPITSSITLYAQWSETAGLTYTYNGSDGYTVTAFDGVAKVVTIASTYNDETNGEKPVTAIADSSSTSGGVFYKADMVSVTIPENITTLGKYAFSSCSNLHTVFYTGSVDDWCNITFNHSSATPLYNSSDLYILNENGNSSLSTDYTKLVNAVISSSVTTLNSYTFYKCTSIESVTIESNVSSLPTYFFYYCSNLKEVNLPSTIETISSYSLQYCTSLESIVIPEGVTTFGSSVFSGCTALTDITLPKSLTTIGSSSFSNCSSLKNVYYGGTADDWCNIPITSYSMAPFTSSQKGHFYVKDSAGGYTEATDIVITSATSIPTYAFFYFSYIKNITIPSIVTSIGTHSFRYCNSLESFTVDSNNANYASIDGVLYNKDITELMVYPACRNGANYTAPSTVNTITTYAFYYACNLQNLVLSDISSLGASAFQYATSIMSVEFGENSTLTAINNSTFSYCESLQTIIIPSTVTKLTYQAFAYCTSLTSITISTNTTSIVASVFTGCELLTVYVDGAYTPTGWLFTDIDIEYLISSIISGDWEYIETSTTTAKIIGYNGNDSVVTIPATLDGLTVTVLESAFKDNTTITSITISEGLITISEYAFDGCTNLSSVSLPSTLETIEKYAFLNCSSLYEIIIPQSVTEIGFSVVTMYNQDTDGRSGTTFVVSNAESMILVMNTNMFYKNGSTVPENTLLLAGDIYFEDGMITPVSDKTLGSFPFAGTLDGGVDKHSISGIDSLSDSYLIYSTYNATFTNLVINVDQDGGMLTASADGEYITFDNIKTDGDVYIPQGIANYSPLVGQSSAKVTFSDVSTYTNITALGTSYFSNFLGGSSSDTVTFKNCINYGTLQGSSPSAFIGNNYNMSGVSIVLSETVYNAGAVKGFVETGYFASVGNGDSTYSTQVAYIESHSLNVAPALVDEYITKTVTNNQLTITDTSSTATHYMVIYTAWAGLVGTTSGSRMINVNYTVERTDNETVTTLPSTLYMTTTLPDDVIFASDVVASEVSAMMFVKDGLYYLYADTSTLSGISANCELNNNSVTATVIGLDANQNIVSVQG